MRYILSFNGTGGATAPAALGNFGTAAFSIGAWVKLAPGQGRNLFSKRPGCSYCNFWEVYVGHTVSVSVCQDTGGTNYFSISGSKPIDDNAWHYLTFVRSGVALSLYVDGALDVSQNGPLAYNFNSTAPFLVADSVCAGSGGNGSARFNGLLDEMRVYGRALSGSEIAGLSQNAPAASCAGRLLTYWKFNEGTGATAYDACHSVVNTYGADDRLVQTVGGNGNTVTYTYDGPNGYGSLDVNNQTQKGLLSRKTDGNGHVTTYTYTALNQPLATYYPDGTGESVTYGAAGNVLTRTKPDGKVIRYTYDKDNRLTDITYPTLHATQFGYDADGRRTLMTDATGTTTWAYADGLHLTAITSPQGTVSYAYDGDGRRRTMGATGVGSGWTYGYDSGGRLTSLQSPSEGTAGFHYDGADRLYRKDKGDGDYETYGYDVANQMIGIGYYWFDGTLRNSRIYTYNAAGNLAKDDQGFYALSYLYDGAGQLTGEVSSGPNPPPALGYVYDQNGNRPGQTSNGSVVQSFTYDAHDKLTAGTGETPAYDLNGSLQSDTLTGQTFAYDEEDRLTNVSGPGYTDTFTYNGLGLRVGKSDTTNRHTGGGQEGGGPRPYGPRCRGWVPQPSLSLCPCIPKSGERPKGALFCARLDSPARNGHNTLRQLCEAAGGAGLCPG